MYQHSLYVLLRRFLKDPVFSLITIANLTLGFTTFILLSQYLNGMFSWDKFNEKYDRIYRVQLFQDQEENIIRHSWSVPAALAGNDLKRIPEIEKVVLMHDVGDNNKNGVFFSTDKKNQFLIRYGYFADQTVFDIFTFHFLEGDPNTALTKPYSIVLSKSLADRLFQGAEALGRQLYAENKVVLTVTGVYNDIPFRSHWQPAYLLPMISYAGITGDSDYETDYGEYGYYIYVLMKPNTNPADVDDKIHFSLKDYEKNHYPYLRPMSALYLQPFFERDIYIMIYLFAFIALLVLILSSINYINLQTASSVTRFREIGIKKATGFSKKELWFQFMFESVSLALFCGLLSIPLALLFYPYFNKIAGGEIISVLFFDWKLVTQVLAVALITGILSGIHPAYAISRFNPVTALKQKMEQERAKGISLKKILVTLQFSISIFLLTTGFIVYRQTHYMLTKDLGFESHNLLFSNIITDKKGSFESLRQRLMAHPEIVDACQSDYIPFILPGGDELNWEENDETDEKVFVRFYNVSYDYVPTFKLDIVKGRNFSKEFPADNEKCILNETAVKVFGWTEPVGHHIRIYDRYYEVIGIIRDHVAFSVHNKLEPQLLRLMPDSIQSDNVYSIRFLPGSENQAMEKARKEFEDFFTDDAFELRNIQYRIRNENAVLEWRKLMKVSIFFALVSIIISSIGLFGLMLFFTRNKMKEIGIRKVLGFSSGNLYFNMSSGFIKLLVISVLIAWPAGYYIYEKLPGANKYNLQAWEFIIAAMIALSVALLTISYQIIRATRARSVDILKDE